jgi:hypothetical protein
MTDIVVTSFLNESCSLSKTKETIYSSSYISIFCSFIDISHTFHVVTKTVVFIMILIYLFKKSKAHLSVVLTEKFYLFFFQFTCPITFKKTKLIAKDGSYLSELVNKLESYQQGYMPTVWCFPSIASTIAVRFQTCMKVNYERFAFKKKSRFQILCFNFSLKIKQRSINNR